MVHLTHLEDGPMIVERPLISVAADGQLYGASGLCGDGAIRLIRQPNDAERADIQDCQQDEIALG